MITAVILLRLSNIHFKTALAIMTDSSSDSDIQLPKLTIKKQHTSATATATETTAVDLNDVSTTT